MKKYKIPFKATVYGFVVVEAESKNKLLEDEPFHNQVEWLDEHSNKSDYDFDLDNIEEQE